jgi:phenylacetate-CoA ligase
MIPKIEIAAVAEIKLFQEQKMAELLNYVNVNSLYYSSLFAKNKIDITAIKTIEDLSRLPVTTKEDLQKYNDDFLCVPIQKIIDYATTSGTL